MDTGFQPVKHRHDKIIIVACGGSLRGFDLKRLDALEGIKTIAVNSAYYHFRPDYWCTIDPTCFANIIKAYRPSSYKYVGYKEPFVGVHNLRRFVIKTRDAVTDENSRLCERKDEIQTHNSGYAAFNLAYHMEAKKVLLLGFDANSGPHFYDDIPSDKHGWETSLSKMPALFRFALPQVAARGMEVMNGCADSLIDAFPRCTIEQGLNWIQAE